MSDTASSLKLLSPADGVLVDPIAIPFSWEGNGEDPFILQLAWDENFQKDITTVTVGHKNALTLYDLVTVEEDTPIFWRIRQGKKGNWSSAGRFIAASPERLQMERETSDTTAREAARERLTEYLAEDERIPYPMSMEKNSGSDKSTAFYLGAIILTFVALLVLLLIFGQIDYPAEATTM